MLERFAGNPGVLKLLAATGSLAAATPAVVGIADLFMGDTNGVNSGEIPVNALLGLGGFAGAGLGAFGGAMTDPIARFSTLAGLESLRTAAEYKLGMAQSPEDLERIENRMRGLAEEGDRLKAQVDMDREAARQRLGVSQQEAAQHVADQYEGRFHRRLGAGAWLGGAIATPLSIMAMWDQGKAQPPQPPAAGAGVNQSLG